MSPNSKTAIGAIVLAQSYQQARRFALDTLGLDQRALNNGRCVPITSVPDSEKAWGLNPDIPFYVLDPSFKGSDVIAQRLSDRGHPENDPDAL